MPGFIRRAALLIVPLALGGCPLTYDDEPEVDSGTKLDGPGIFIPPTVGRDGGPPPTTGPDGPTTGPRPEGGTTLPPATRGTGAVLLTSSVVLNTTGQPFMAGSAGAAFIPGPPGSPTPSNCSRTNQGPCVVQTCTGPPQNTPPPSRLPHSGNITVSGGKRPLTLVPMADGNYMPISDTSAGFWDGGESLNLSSVGGEVPAFRITAAAPRYLVVTSPALPTNGALMVNRATGLSLTWNGGGAGNFALNLSQGGATGPSTLVVCIFPASAGSGTIPATALRSFTTTQGFFSAIAQNIVTGDFAGWTISAIVSSGPRSMQSSGPFQGPANFQ